MGYKETVEARLLSRLRVDKQTGCWLWVGPVNKKGYVNMSVSIPGRTKRLASIQRIAVWLWLGVELDGDHEVCHTCDTSSCANPDHLIAGTHGQNQKEAYARGLQPKRDKRWARKLSREKVEKIRKVYATGRYSQDQIAKRVGVSQSMVSQIIRNVGWK